MLGVADLGAGRREEMNIEIVGVSVDAKEGRDDGRDDDKRIKRR